MQVIHHADADFSDRLRDLTSASSSLFDPGIEARTRLILEEVRGRGDQALLEFTERFDGPKLTPEQLSVTQAEFLTASLSADEPLRRAVGEAEKNIAAFAKKSLRRNWQTRNSHGGLVG